MYNRHYVYFVLFGNDIYHPESHISACHDIVVYILYMNPKDKKLLSFYLMNRFIFLRMKLYFPSNETIFSPEGNETPFFIAIPRKMLTFAL